jgi:hypothetical protein
MRNTSKILRLISIGVVLLFATYILINVFLSYFNLPKLDLSKKYDLSCVTNEDCTLKKSSGICPSYACVNKKYSEDFNSSLSNNNMVPLVYATSCRMPSIVACKCQERQCINIDFENPEFEEDCNLINDGIQKDICYLNIAKKSNTLNSCKAINQQDIKKDCFTALAKMKQNYTICSNIDVREDANECVALVAQLSRNITLCELTSDEISCHEIFYEENCDLLNQEIDAGRVNYTTQFILRVFDYSGNPYRCKKIMVLQEKCFPTVCTSGWHATYKTDSNGMLLLNKTDILLNEKYHVDDTDPWMSYSRFQLQNYTNEVNISISVRNV